MVIHSYLYLRVFYSLLEKYNHESFRHIQTACRVLTVDPLLRFTNMLGILRNLFLSNTNMINTLIAYEAHPAIVGRQVNLLAIQSEASISIPVGSAAIIAQGVKDFIACTSIDAGIKVWEDLFNFYKVDATYKNTPLVGVLSIANYSAQYWSYVVNTWDSGHDNPPHPAFRLFKIPGWLKATLIDLAGALVGAEAGISVGSIIPGIGNGVGAVVGAIIGGAGASAGGGA